MIRRNRTALLAVVAAGVLSVSCAKKNRLPERRGSAEAQGSIAEGQVEEVDAIRLAEAFVRENGYTNAPLPGMDAGGPPEPHDDNYPLWLRHNTLLPDACGVMPSNILRASEGWTVMFCINTHNKRSRAASPDIDRAA